MFLQILKSTLAYAASRTFFLNFQEWKFDHDTQQENHLHHFMEMSVFKTDY